MIHFKHISWYVCLTAAIWLLTSCQANQPDTIQKATRQVADRAGGSVPAGKDLQADMLSVSVHTMRVPDHDQLWGYEIYSGDSLIIRQLQVPAAAGQFGFTSEKGAKIIGEMVVGKLKTGQIPSISLEELKQSGVAYKPF